MHYRCSFRRRLNLEKSILRSNEAHLTSSLYPPRPVVGGLPEGTLPSVVSFGSLSEIVGDVFTRADEGIGEILDEIRHWLQTYV
jgi:hypothetical protein